MIKPPAFWFSKTSLWPYVLKPFEWLYRFFYWMNWKFTRPYRSQIPLVCIGNTGLGGAGKTPTALALGMLLEELSVNYGYLTRGYGGNAQGPIFVESGAHASHQVGDEPLLLARQAKTIVAKKRPAGIELAQNQKHDVLLMDDGYQNPSVEKKLHILVIDGKRGFGNGHVFPAGPLRESIAQSFERASAIVLIGNPSLDVAHHLQQVDCPVFQARLVIDPPKDLGHELFAFAGIGFPDKFFDSLTGAGFQVSERQSFPDHHPYTDAEIERLIQKAQSLRLPLVTTEKDYVRLSQVQRKAIIPIPARLVFESSADVKSFLKRELC